MEGSKSAAEALKQLEALQLPDTSKIAELRNGLLAEVRIVTEYPRHFERIEAENNFAEQLERRNGILRSAGLTTDIHGNAIAYPSYDEIRAKLLERPELLTKMNQGFVRLQPVPIGAPLSAYFTALEDGLRRYAEEKRLRATDGRALELDSDKPLRKRGVYHEGDVNGSVIYEPTQLTTGDHGGKTKAELIAEDGPTRVLLTEKIRDIPRVSGGATIGGRLQIEMGKAANRYLQMIGKAPYELETPYALETELAHTLTHLHETRGEVLNSSPSVSAAYCPGGWLPNCGDVPFVSFSRVERQLRVDGIGPFVSLSDFGVRCAVRVS